MTVCFLKQEYLPDGDRFCLSLVRQFTIEVDGDYDYIEQIHLDLFYMPDETLNSHPLSSDIYQDEI